MADVFPPRDLPGRSEEWGRQVENRIEAGEKSEQQLEQKVDNGLRATGGQLAVLSRQIDALASQQLDLLGRTSAATFWANSPFTVSSTTSDVLIPGMGVTFSVNEPRVVKIQSTMQVALYKGSGGGATIAQLSLGVAGMALDPSETWPAQASSPSTVTNDNMISQVTVSALLQVDPGSYDVELRYGTNITSSGGFVVFNSGVTIVDVLQRV